MAQQLHDTSYIIIDWQQCLSVASNDKEVAKSLLKMLIKSIPNDYQNIKTLYEDRNYPALTEHLHRFHGGLCYTGLPLLKAATQELEKIARNRLFSEIDTAFKNFSNEIMKVLTAANIFNIK